VSIPGEGVKNINEPAAARGDQRRRPHSEKFAADIDLRLTTNRLDPTTGGPFPSRVRETITVSKGDCDVHGVLTL
jgi:hypothetical protein